MMRRKTHETCSNDKENHFDHFKQIIGVCYIKIFIINGMQTDSLDSFRYININLSFRLLLYSNWER